MKKYVLYDKTGNPSILPGWVDVNYYIAKGFSLDCPKPDNSKVKPAPKKQKS